MITELFLLMNVFIFAVIVLDFLIPFENKPVVKVVAGIFSLLNIFFLYLGEFLVDKLTSGSDTILVYSNSLSLTAPVIAGFLTLIYVILSLFLFITSYTNYKSSGDDDE